jgi:hypothetical protein
MEQVININDIKMRYPDEWVLLGNPEINEKDQKILSGVLMYHSSNKKEVCYLGKPLIAGYDKTALFFNRVTPRQKRSVIASLFYPINR